MTITLKVKAGLTALCLLMLGSFAVIAAPANAAVNTLPQLNKISNAAQLGGNLNEDTIFEQIGKGVQIIMSLLGVIFFLYLLYAGFIWMTSQGDEPKITKAKGMIINSVIGIAIILSALAISTFVLTQLQNATT